MSDEATAPEAADEKGKGKGKKEKGKGKKAKEGLTVAGHPRAGAHVRLAKGWGGLIAFVLAAYLSLSAGLTAYQAGERAILAGIAGYLLGWFCSVTVWRHLLVAELRALAEHAQRGAQSASPAPAVAHDADEGTK